MEEEFSAEEAPNNDEDNDDRRSEEAVRLKVTSKFSNIKVPSIQEAYKQNR